MNIIVFKQNDGKILMEEDSNIINKLLSFFQREINKDLESSIKS